MDIAVGKISELNKESKTQNSLIFRLVCRYIISKLTATSSHSNSVFFIALGNLKKALI